MITKKVQNFLKDSLKNAGLKKQDFVEQSGIPSNTYNNVIHAKKNDIKLITILKIANYFNAPLDKVIGREEFVQSTGKSFNEINVEDASLFLKEFLKNKLKNDGLTPYKFSKDCGLNENIVQKFIKESSSKKTLSINSIVSIADYFNLSLDEIIGRTSSIDNTNQVRYNKPFRIFDSMAKEDIKSVEAIRKSVLQEQTINANPQNSNTLPHKTSNKEDKTFSK